MRIAALLVAISVLVSACGGGDDDKAPITTQLTASGPIDISLDPVELSPEFPTDLPIPVDLLIIGSEVLEGESTTIFEVTGWHAGESMLVAGDYLAVLDELGFEVTSRDQTSDKLFFNAESADWFVSAGFFPDPIRLEGTSVGITVVPIGAVSSG
mgnify:CR=1 FL=1